MGTTPLYLEVPFEHRAIAKQAGAWWDSKLRKWYVPPGRPVDFAAIGEWIPIQPCPPGQGVAVDVLGLGVDCYRCGRRTMAIVGLDPGRGDGFATTTRGFNLRVAECLLAGSRPAEVGPVRDRRSRTAGESYLSNGCRHCDALIGAFPLGEHVHIAACADRQGIVVLGRGEVHPLLLEAAFASEWIGG
jgi:hypothetical protein